jgi:hypothetical protein
MINLIELKQSGGQVPLKGELTGSNILGAMNEASKDSVYPLYYGSLHNDLRKAFAKIPSPDANWVCITFIEGMI